MTAQDGVVELLSEKIREISIAEFFEKNKHLLGYENPTKSLLTVVKEGVDNSIDAALEARILPSIKVSVKNEKENIFRVKIEDNGPGIDPKKLPIAFGKFLVGSKFYRLKQLIGTQGIGMKGAILYAQLTTGKPAKITTYYKGKKYTFELTIDVLKNEPKIISNNVEDLSKNLHGLNIELLVEGRYIEKGQSIPTYLKYLWIANPYAEIIYDGPQGGFKLERVINELPPSPKEIKPHPYGVELGRLKRMIELSNHKDIVSFLTKEFSRIGRDSAIKVCKLARIEPSINPKELTLDKIEKLHKALQSIKLKAPPLDCLSPLKEEHIIETLKKEFKPEYVVAVVRKPKVYRGNPFQVQTALAYGGEIVNINGEENQAILLRFANHTPLLYNQHDCAITRAVEEIDWRSYKINQSKGSIPTGPLVIFVDLISTWIPYKSEGKQAIAEYPEIIKEIKLSLQEAARMLSSYLKRKIRMQEIRARKGLFEAYSTIFSEYLSKIIKENEKVIYNKIMEVISKGKYKEQEEEKKEVVEEIKIE